MPPPSTSEDVAARAAFVQWASSQAGAPRDPDSLVQDVEVSYEPIGLLSTEFHGRRVVWKSVPANGKARVTVPAIAIDSVDPWSVDADVLRARSDHIAICDVCAGEKKVRCPSCGGAGKTICTACHGQRKTYGYAANGSRRLLNCTTCRGKGELDCPDCRRGIAMCAACGGEGRVQRWMEPEWWRRPVASAHPRPLAERLGWDADPLIINDAELVADVDRPRRLDETDLRNIPVQWLTQLAPQPMPGERIARQRLRIARVPTFTVVYRLGASEHRAPFTSLRLTPSPHDRLGAFARRASNLRLLFWLLTIVGLGLTLLSLGRGLFYWSLPTLLSLAAFGGALGAIYGAVSDWTGTRRYTRAWVGTAGAFAMIALALAVAALPRDEHAQRLISEGKLDAAESELRALGDGVAPGLWADLHLARIRAATEAEEARNELAQIPRTLPQYATAVSFATPLLLTEARQKMVRRDWSGAANDIEVARRLGVAGSELVSLANTIHSAALTNIDFANDESDARRRLQLRLQAEKALVAWERATEQWGTPALIELRSAMARDVATLERSERRRGRE